MRRSEEFQKHFIHQAHALTELGFISLLGGCERLKYSVLAVTDVFYSWLACGRESLHALKLGERSLFVP